MVAQISFLLNKIADFYCY